MVVAIGQGYWCTSINNLWTAFRAYPLKMCQQHYVAVIWCIHSIPHSDGFKSILIQYATNSNRIKFWLLSDTYIIYILRMPSLWLPWLLMNGDYTVFHRPIHGKKPFKEGNIRITVHLCRWVQWPIRRNIHLTLIVRQIKKYRKT